MYIINDLGSGHQILSPPQVNQFRVYEDFAKDFSYVMETLARIQSQELDVNNIMLSVQATCGLSLVDLFHIPIPQSETYLDVMRVSR